MILDIYTLHRAYEEGNKGYMESNMAIASRIARLEAVQATIVKEQQERALVQGIVVFQSS